MYSRALLPFLGGVLALWISVPAALLAEEGNPARRVQLEKEALAWVGEELITVDAFRAEIARRSALSGAPPESSVDLERWLEELVRRQALLQRAKASGYEARADLLEIWQQLLIKTYLRDTLEVRMAEAKVEEAEVAAYYETHAESFEAPARSQAAIVFYEVAPKTTPENRAETRRQAEAALVEAAGLDPDIRHFGDIARRDSSDRASRYQGGVIGWISHLEDGPTSWPKPVVSAVLQLSTPGELGPLIDTPQGFYLVRLVDREPARRQPLEQVAAGIRHQLLREKRAALERVFDEELRAELGVRVDLDLLHSLGLPILEKTPPTVPPTEPPLPAATGVDASGGSR